MVYQPLLFNAKAILGEKLSWSYVNHFKKDRGVHAFPRSISLKMNIKAQREFKNVAVQHVTQYATRTSPSIRNKKEIFRIYLVWFGFMAYQPLQFI